MNSIAQEIPFFLLLRRCQIFHIFYKPRLQFTLQIECWNKANKKFLCLTEEKLETIVDNLKYDELKRAFNNSDSLGSDYIRECSTLATYERKVLREVYGSAKCTIFEIFQIIADRKECDAVVNKRKDVLADLASSA